MLKTVFVFITSHARPQLLYILIPFISLSLSQPLFFHIFVLSNHPHVDLQWLRWPVRIGIEVSGLGCGNIPSMNQSKIKIEEFRTDDHSLRKYLCI